MRKITIIVAIIIGMCSTVKAQIKIEKEYYPGGNLKEEIPYINGKVNGIVKHYYESGKLKDEIPYINEKQMV